MDFFVNLVETTVLLITTVIFIAGSKGAMFHNGVGLFELIGMLWRGDIKSKWS